MAELQNMAPLWMTLHNIFCQYSINLHSQQIILTMEYESSNVNVTGNDARIRVFRILYFAIRPYFAPQWNHQ